MRANSDFCCYDEPFNRNLINLPKDNKKRTRGELIRLYSESPQGFLERYAPILLDEETDGHLSQKQAAYLRWLAESSQGKAGVLLESVRLSFKLRAVYDCVPNSFLVHLYRQPRAWVSSNLIPPPSGRWLRNIANRYRRLSFWRRRGFYDNWGYEYLIDKEIEKDSLWGASGISASQLREKPAAVKLAALWRWAYMEVEGKGRELWRDRFVSIPFEDFCGKPGMFVRKIQVLAGVATSDDIRSELKSPNLGFKPTSATWDHVLAEAGFGEVTG